MVKPIRRQTVIKQGYDGHIHRIGYHFAVWMDINKHTSYCRNWKHYGSCIKTDLLH